MRQTFAKLKKMGILTQYNIGPKQVSWCFADPDKLRAIMAEHDRDFDRDLAIYAAFIKGLAELAQK